jgi:hypothetical protein
MAPPDPQRAQALRQPARPGVRVGRLHLTARLAIGDPHGRLLTAEAELGGGEASLG